MPWPLILRGLVSPHEPILRVDMTIRDITRQASGEQFRSDIANPFKGRTHSSNIKAGRFYARIFLILLFCSHLETSQRYVDCNESQSMDTMVKFHQFQNVCGVGRNYQGHVVKKKQPSRYYLLTFAMRVEHLKNYCSQYEACTKGRFKLVYLEPV